MTLGRNFARTLAAPGFANLADGVFQVALPLLAVQLTRSPALIAGVTVAARLPWLAAPGAGALAARLGRRQTMIRVNLVRTVLLGGLALAVAADQAGLAMLYAVALLLGIAETLFDTSDLTMIRVNLVRTVLLGGLALAVAADQAGLAMLYAVALLLGIAETLFDT